MKFPMTRKRALIAGAIAVAAAAGITGAVGASGIADSDEPITGEALAEASRVALDHLDHLGQGTVTDTEVGDEESYYEVEVTLDDGTEIDVQLDEQFKVVGSEVEGVDEEANDND